MNYLFNEIINIAKFLIELLLPMFILIVPVLIIMAYLTFAERKVIGYIQLRTGPTKTGPFGLLQAFADALKLMHKEIIMPESSNRIIFFLAPVIIFVFNIGAWCVMPLSARGALINSDVSLIFLLACSSLGAYGIILGGWSSKSEYPLLGALRSIAQIISYEIALGFIILTIIISSGSTNLKDIVDAQKHCWYFIPHLPLAFMFFVITLAETNRAPFDLPESESELVSGYNVEYSSMPFALFFLGEYVGMILMSTFTTLLFFGGWHAPSQYLEFIPSFIWLGLKVAFFLFCFLWVRAALPRFRYDHLMRLGWKVFLPWSFFWMVLTGVIKWIF
jgi:NADH-quinone oxidoreductase subunit H